LPFTAVPLAAKGRWFMSRIYDHIIVNGAAVIGTINIIASNRYTVPVMQCYQQFIDSSEAMEALGARLACAVSAGGLIFLEGELGTGKTTLVRGLLRAMAYEGKVKSPTYTLLEDYEVAGRHICHMDLYRLIDAEELEWLGIRDVLNKETLCLVEWPDKGKGVLPGEDLRIEIDYKGAGRDVRLCAASDLGDEILALLG